MTVEAVTASGCPCGTWGRCCDDPQPATPDHACADDSLCEDCYAVECRACREVCQCQL